MYNNVNKMSLLNEIYRMRAYIKNNSNNLLIIQDYLKNHYKLLNSSNKIQIQIHVKLKSLFSL